jgi:GH15 family glucan-1,4-alpha-glucosidase
VSSPIEDYAIIGDTHTVALVSRNGSIDWWCAPRVDSGACFAALLGDESNGRWLMRTRDDPVSTTRRYEPDTLVLETVFETADCTVAVIDFMPPGNPDPTIHRVVQCRRGRAHMEMELVVRFDYGSIVPWVRATGDGLRLVAGPDGLRLHSPQRLEGRGQTTVAEFEIPEGGTRAFSLTWFDPARAEPLPLDSLAALHRTRQWWHEWVGRCTYDGQWRDEVVRSLITLKALTYAPTGAVCAAATTSLPEALGGERNWDYRYSWLRDATMTLQALLLAGYMEEATAWSHWLRRAVAGSPGDFQIMYGVGGDRRLTELELDWLSGYEGSRPVRVGNEASEQFQLDVFGEVMDSALTAVRQGLTNQAGYGGEVIVSLMRHLEDVWDQPDDGIWEVRGPRRHFTHSKVMAWVAFDRAVRIAAGVHMPAATDAVERWRALRDEVHAEVCEKGWNDEVGSFTQYYGSSNLDASLLMMGPVGFLPMDDPRIVATVEAIESRLTTDGFVSRYQTDDGDGDAASTTVDGLKGKEGAFLLTTFWLADNLALMGRRDEAQEMFERLLALRNDVGLLSEEYDPDRKRLLGNFPQAFSHIGLIHTAANLSLGDTAPGQQRSSRP